MNRIGKTLLLFFAFQDLAFLVETAKTADEQPKRYKTADEQHKRNKTVLFETEKTADEQPKKNKTADEQPKRYKAADEVPETKPLGRWINADQKSEIQSNSDCGKSSVR